uniref:Ubiquitin domain containing 1 n=1 Tax=Buteo japonicus TaxID=224669 RepID=A0A8C0BW05_9AVES
MGAKALVPPGGKGCPLVVAAAMRPVGSWVGLALAEFPLAVLRTVLCWAGRSLGHHCAWCQGCPGTCGDGEVGGSGPKGEPRPLAEHPLPSPGRNEPLKKERPKWKSDYPMTDGQLRSKRDEFWDTAPAFEGRKEIWDALKAAAYAVEANDHSLAQAILDGASITLPHGSLTECYDELGNRYQLPVYCLAPPVNLILERSEEEMAEPAEPLPNARREFALKVRLSTGKDLRLSASMGDTIGQLKKQLQVQEGIDLAWQRWFFSGKLLTDRTRLQETKIQKDFVVQVIVNQPLPPRN